ncbi:reverse transcriptase domain-containing protein [Ammoniphilus resinae]|uniref:Group II intron reverse transcriptase/maturase n=1 Tax=Ammoniphilus resinae TaxID=861532 RepID=A0ABS4GVV5_9BACL|nr:reverse transcriptase domain-containing protein [Ammoniphilus resinae]MBP1934395.1 group II intron reverse transcriptase/maturase [Ammoniphilus resinae]
MERTNVNYGVSVITCTNKSRFMKNIFTNYHKQTVNNKELIIILNNDQLNLNEWRQEARKFENVSVYQLSAKVSLGNCLNYAITKAKYNHIAKFDDDDYYAPAYLSDSLHAMQLTNADVVGKRTHFMYLPDSKRLYLRFPTRENQFVSRIQGGTILAKRKVFEKVQFRDVSLGEDNRFYEDCHANGLKIYSTNRFFYVYKRRKRNSNHTWKTNRRRLVHYSRKVGKMKDYKPHVVPPNSRAQKVYTFPTTVVRFDIPQQAVTEAYEQCKRKKTFGIDMESIQKFHSTGMLNHLMEELSSGEYVPFPVQRAYTRTPYGKMRALGIPTVRDHIVQTMLRDYLSSAFKERWHPNSFLRLRGKAAKKAALKAAKKRCLKYDWALILDVKKYGDNIIHRSLMKMLRRHFNSPWVLRYTERMLKVPIQTKNGSLLFRPKKGLPHDNTLSPFLADFYMHEIFDQWMKQHHPNLVFERFMDDIIIHCRSKKEAKSLLSQISRRLSAYRLQINNKKTKIVYCKDRKRKGRYKNVSFQFLENKFRARGKKKKSTVFGPGKNLIFK